MKNSVSKLLFIAIMSLLFSCTHSISLIGTGCHSAGQWGKGVETVYEKKIWTRPGKTEVRLNEILKESDLNCRSLDSLEVNLVTDFWDGIYSLLPGFKRQTLIIKGIAFSLKEEDTPGIGP